MVATHMLTICHQFRTLLLLPFIRLVYLFTYLLYTRHRITNTLVFTQYTSLYFQLDVSTIVLWVIVCRKQKRDLSYQSGTFFYLCFCVPIPNKGKKSCHFFYVNVSIEHRD